MKLKSYRLKLKKPQLKKRKIPGRDLIVGATGAIIGVAVVSQTADVLSTL